MWRLRAALLTLLAAFALAGCERAAEAPDARPALWRATDGDTVIWLFGTIHLLPREVVWNTGPVAKAVAESNTLITEIAPGDPQAQAAAFLAIARANGLPPIRERVPPEARAGLDAALASSGASAAALDRMASWAAAMTLSSGAGRGAGGTREAAPEAVLARAFAGRQQEALETFAGQLGIFAALPEADQRALLGAAIRSARDGPAEYARLLNAWRTGDLSAIAAAFGQGFRDTPGLRGPLLTRRNITWADDLKRRTARPGVLFVAVGAGHMVGSDGLPALLSARGFRVARVQ